MNTGQIRKSSSSGNFAVIPNEIVQDTSMSAKAKGLICYLLSLPKDWIINRSELQNHFTDGRDSLASGWKELEAKGYLESKAVRDESGKFLGYNYIVHSESIFVAGNPYTEKPDTDNPISEKPISENPQLQINSTTKETNTKETYSDDFEKWWKEYHLTGKVKKGKDASYKHWQKLLARDKDICLDVVQRYARSNEPKFLKAPYNYLREKRFKDEIENNNQERSFNPDDYI